MSSPGRNVHAGSFLGAGADVTVRLPFVPKSVKFWATGGVWGIKLVGGKGMDGANYLSSTAADVGVTINAAGSMTVANGADVNVSGQEVYFEAEE